MLRSRLFITNSYYQLMMTLVLVWATLRPVVEHSQRLHRADLVRPRGLLRHRRLYDGARPDPFRSLAMAPDPDRRRARRLAGLLIGFPTFRLRGHYFALAMLAYPLARALRVRMARLPGSHAADEARKCRRLYAIRRPTHLHAAGAGHDDRDRPADRASVERSRFGMALIAIKQNEAAAEAAGINTLAWKLRAITLSGAIAGAIGAFYAVVLLVVTPVSVFGMLVSAQALTVTMFGGVGTVWGPVIGSAILIPAAEILQAEFGARFPASRASSSASPSSSSFWSRRKGCSGRGGTSSDAAGRLARDRKIEVAAADRSRHRCCQPHARAAAGEPTAKRGWQGHPLGARPVPQLRRTEGRAGCQLRG